MTGFQNISIPQASAPNDPRTLAPASSNIQKPSPAAKNVAAKNGAADQPFVLPPGHYLSWHELEHHYGPSRQSFRNIDVYKSARLDFVKTINMDDPPFNHPWNSDYKRQDVEDTWAGLPATKRNQVEMSALAYKYQVIVQAPSREVPAYALPLAFTDLEAQYFNVAERRLASYADTMQKRSAWLRDLGLFEPAYHALCSTEKQKMALDLTYKNLTVVKRRSIEAKARYLKVMLNPPNPTFGKFEEQYSVHKREDFARQSDHKSNRRHWLRAIGLDVEPFCWYPQTATELGIAQFEKAEVAWHDFGLARCQELEAKATEYRDAQTWGFILGTDRGEHRVHTY